MIIIDVNEAPTSVTLSGSNTVLADGQPGDVIGQFSVEDPDHNQAHSFVLKGPNSDLFTVSFVLSIVWTSVTGINMYKERTDFGNISGRLYHIYILNIKMLST